MRGRYPCGGMHRREFLGATAVASWGAAVASWGASAVSAQEPRRKSDPAIPGGTLGIPGPYPGRVIEVRNPGLVHDGRRDRAAVRGRGDLGGHAPHRLLRQALTMVRMWSVPVASASRMVLPV